MFASEAGEAQRFDNLSDPHNLKPMGAAQPCANDIPKSSSASLSTSGQPKEHAQACLVKVDSTIDALANRRVSIIDTRKASEFDKYRIPGSLNIQPHALKTKAFLKSHGFVLIDESHTSAELERVCADLKRNGYAKASVMQGGLFLWKARGGMLEGDTIAAARALSTVRPAELMQEQPHKDWLIIDVSNRKNADFKKYFPMAVSIPWSRDRKNEKPLLAAMNSAGNKRILVVDETGESYAWIEGQVGTQRKDVLYLEGGLRGYLKYQREQVAMWKQRDEQPKRKGCSA